MHPRAMPQEPRAGNQEPKAQSPKPCTSRRSRLGATLSLRGRCSRLSPQNSWAGRGRRARWNTSLSRRVRPSRLGRRSLLGRWCRLSRQSRQVRTARLNAPRSRQNRRGTRFAPRPFLLLRRLCRGGLSFRRLFRQSRRGRATRLNAPLSRQNAPRSLRAFFLSVPKRLRQNFCRRRAGQGRGSRLPGRLAPSTVRARLFLNLRIIPHPYLQGSGPRPSRKWNSTAGSAAMA